ncbi:uncharacterized protein K489DRAFT_383791 [Dissoconium aciculare CBS 342.82]|uniref:3-hydroxyisobutyrate dehydrogenase-like NAD-binding domain-containing protein n=1 Tax=Dissoconium aciculare CBS 342.82 TaxID=1314786 RepID=A0A6J3LUV9_9PEZI|nr:uncharacterized protein K489DRAFT_383791 [Dissoconium aciculare CBS 342.82]KAF1819556.1 hypothetical protein K489DRAFT_383791 [Dissoconium aciculare CBS 342.82]
MAEAWLKSEDKALNLLAVTSLAATAEVLGLVATVGLNTESIHDQIVKSSASGFVASERGSRILSNGWHSESSLATSLGTAYAIADAARKAHVPTPLAGTAEQLLLQAAHLATPEHDDATLVQVYLPQGQGELVSEMKSADKMMVASYQVRKETVIDLLVGIQLAATVEAMALAKALNQSRRDLFEQMVKVDGSGEVHDKCISGMLEKDAWTLADCPQAEEHGKRLADAVEKCRKIQYPCPMAVTALQQFHFAIQKGKTIKNEGR